MKYTFRQKLWFFIVRLTSWIFPRRGAEWAAEIFETPDYYERPESEKDWYESAKKSFIGDGIPAYEWGPASGPVVVLLHGWSGRGTQMGYFAGPLAEKGYRVVALDGPAHGEKFGGRTNVGEYARYLLRAQKDLGPFQAVIAHSLGAGCAVIASSWGLSVEKLVLIAGPSRYELVVQNYLDQIKISPRAQKIFFQDLEKRVGVSAAELNIGVLGSKLGIPAIIVHDLYDKAVRFKAALEIKQFWPEIQVFETKGLGHRRVLRDPQVLKVILDFLG